MTDLSKKTLMWVDNGLFPAFARRLAPFFKKVYYTSAWRSAFPSYRQTRLGTGFPEIERVNYPLLKADEVDLWVFADVFWGDLQVFLEERGARVFGARMGEELELDRAAFKELLARLGMPVGPWELVRGVDNLKTFLKGKKGWYIKGRSGLSRRDMETWKWKGGHISMDRLRQIEYDLGPMSAEFEFVVEEELPDRVEIGYDGFSIRGQWPNLAMQAYEIKGVGMIGTVKPYDKLALPVRQINAAVQDTLLKYGYSGFLATEIRYGRDKRPYCIDPCARLGSPSNELLQEVFTPESWARALYEGAEGRVSQLVQAAKYAVCFMVYSEQSGKNWQALGYPPALDQWVKLRNPLRVNGKNYSIPQGEPGNLAGVVGTGGTLNEAIAKAEERAKQVDGQLIEIGTDAADKALKVIEEGKNYGIEF